MEHLEHDRAVPVPAMLVDSELAILDAADAVVVVVVVVVVAAAAAVVVVDDTCCLIDVLYAISSHWIGGTVRLCCIQTAQSSPK